MGHGNDDDSGCDGTLYRNASAPICMVRFWARTGYCRSPCAAAMERRLGNKVELVALEDEAELAANAYMAKRLGAWSINSRL